jgi:hypothetical protein
VSPRSTILESKNVQVGDFSCWDLSKIIASSYASSDKISKYYAWTS